MIRTLLGMNRGLLRGALSVILSAQGDIEVVAELDDFAKTLAAARTHAPDVVILDFALVPSGFGVREASASFADLRVLFLVDPRRTGIRDGVVTPSPAVGFLPHTVSPERVVDSVRRIARGEVVIDGELVVAALQATGPLTAREAEVLRAAAEGAPVRDIAAELGLSPGTVRNHLSRVLGKTGARTRIEAVRIARDAGWI